MPVLEQIWTTPQVVKFMGITRQAINQRIRNRKLFSYPGRGVNCFPAWQFDSATHSEHQVVAEFLSRLSPDVDLQDAATWMITQLPGIGRSPAELLLTPADKDFALGLVERYQGIALSTPESQYAQPDEPVPNYDWLPQRLNDTVEDPRSAILRAAAELFAHHGPARVSMRQVAATADVPHSLIYRFYRTKENLLVKVMELFVNSAKPRLAQESDAYAAIANSFGADSGQFGRMLTWATFDGTPPNRLFTKGIRSDGYRSQIEALWNDPSPPAVRAEFDSRAIAAFVGLMSFCWELYGPYLSVLFGCEDAGQTDLKVQIMEVVQLAVYATRPHPGADGSQ